MDEIKFKPNTLWELKKFYTYKRKKNVTDTSSWTCLYLTHSFKICQTASEINFSLKNEIKWIWRSVTHSSQKKKITDQASKKSAEIFEGLNL